MTYDVLGPGALDYFPCRYDGSKLLFRGPRRSLDSPFLAFVGGIETYGRYIRKPFPALVERAIGLPCINLGFPNAGIDAFALDAFVPGAAARAEIAVIQIMGAQNMTNRYYAVHPRRNDRFVSASLLLSALYREVDFADFHFNRHMLGRLLAVSPDRFGVIRRELQRLWVARMRLLLDRIQSRTILLWFAAHPPQMTTEDATGPLGSDPLFITRAMMEAVAPLATSVIEVVASPQALGAGTDGMVFGPLESMAAAEMLGPMAHAEAARAVTGAVRAML